jgi:hypothetical protein
LKIKPTKNWLINRDIKGSWEIPRETCSDCEHGFSCQTLGQPGRPTSMAQKDDLRASLSNVKLETFVSEFFHACERPLGIANRKNISATCRHQFLWLSKHVPLRAKSYLLVEVADGAWEIMLEVIKVESATGLKTPRVMLLKKAIGLIHRLAGIAGLFDRQQICLKTQQSTDDTIAGLDSDYRNMRGSVRVDNPVPIIATALEACDSLQRLTSTKQSGLTQGDNWQSFVRNAYWAADKLAEIQSHKDFGYVDDRGVTKEMTYEDWGEVHEKYHVRLQEQINRLIELAK